MRHMYSCSRTCRQSHYRNGKTLNLDLEAPRSQGILYRWRFPFALSATSEGRTALLRTPRDIPAFCDTLQIPPVEIPNWNRDRPEGWWATNPTPYDEPSPPQSRSRRRQSRSRRGSADRAPDAEAALRAARELYSGSAGRAPASLKQMWFLAHLPFFNRYFLQWMTSRRHSGGLTALSPLDAMSGFVFNIASASLAV